MELLTNEIFRAMGFLFIVGFLGLAYQLATDVAKKTDRNSVLWKGLLWCVGIAIFASLMMGTHIENCEDDPTGCGVVQDYQPTNEQRIARFGYYMTLFYVPVFLGALNGKSKKEQSKSNQNIESENKI